LLELEKCDIILIKPYDNSMEEIALIVADDNNYFSNFNLEGNIK
jgi:hypothetical protein